MAANSKHGRSEQKLRNSAEDIALSMCSGCQITCCTLRIDLTSYDIVRIARYAGKAADDYTGWVQAEADDPCAFKTKEGFVKFSMHKNEDGTCVLFDRFGDVHCSIDDFKPGVCLDYPFTLENGIPTLRGDSICPKANLDRADRAKMSKEALEATKWEVERYMEFVEDWNKSAKGTEDSNDFLIFAMKEMYKESGFLSSFLRHMRRKLNSLRDAK